jgi:hypothetical protein
MIIGLHVLAPIIRPNWKCSHLMIAKILFLVWQIGEQLWNGCYSTGFWSEPKIEKRKSRERRGKEGLHFKHLQNN